MNNVDEKLVFSLELFNNDAFTMPWERNSEWAVKLDNKEVTFKDGGYFCGSYPMLTRWCKNVLCE